MSVCYTALDELNSQEDLKKATWRAGDNTSCKATQDMADVGYGVMLVAQIERRWNTINIYCAKTPRTKWRSVNGWHLTLLDFFNKKLAEAPEGKCLRQFFDKIEDEKAAKALKGLIAAECGINGDEDAVERAAHKACADLEALGLIAGDWMFYPMLTTWKNK